MIREDNMCLGELLSGNQESNDTKMIVDVYKRQHSDCAGADNVNADIYVFHI